MMCFTFFHRCLARDLVYETHVIQVGVKLMNLRLERA